MEVFAWYAAAVLGVGVLLLTVAHAMQLRRIKAQKEWKQELLNAQREILRQPLPSMPELAMPADPSAALSELAAESRRVYSPAFQSALASLPVGMKLDKGEDPQATP
jgi:hypothetical protein